MIDHTASDDCGVDKLGPEKDPFWKDRKGAGLNAIRTHSLLRHVDVIVVRFGPQHQQWNAAFDAGFSAVLGKPLITLHDAEFNHVLKEVNATTCATARNADQVGSKYVTASGSVRSAVDQR